MSYVLSLWAGSVDDLEARLRGSGPIADGPGTRTATPEQADAVAAWLTEAGESMDTVQHTSSAGEWFRDEVIGGMIAERFGADLAGNLLSRPLAGLSWSEFPSVGWVRNAEIRAASAGKAPVDPLDPDTDEGEVVQTITDTLARVLESGHDLVTYYS